jgi:predicted glutamine amidotransferase
MCGIAGIIKNKNLNKLDTYQATMLAWQMSDRGRTSHGACVVNRLDATLHYYKMGSEFSEPSKSVDNPEYLTSLNTLVKSTKGGNMIFVHERAASMGVGGANNRDNTQPLVLEFEDEFISLMHNGSIHNMDELYEKYMDQTAEKSWSDSYLAAVLLFNQKYDWLKEYNGAATLVWYSSVDKKVYLWRGESKTSKYATKFSEERPLYIYEEKDALYFASTAVALAKATINIEKEQIYSLPENTLFCIEENNCTPVEIAKFDRSEAQQNVDYSYSVQGNNRGNIYSMSARTREYFDEVNFSDRSVKELPEKIPNFAGLLKAVPGSINYPADYDYIMSHHNYSGICDFKGPISNDVVLNLVKGLYYTNGQLCHSIVPFYSSGEKVKKEPKDYEAIVVDYYIDPLTGNVMSSNVGGKHDSVYFWHGLMCKGRKSFDDLNNWKTALSAKSLSCFIKHPTHYGTCIIDGNMVTLSPSSQMWKDGVLISKYGPIDEPFPYCHIKYLDEKGTFALDKFSNLLGKFINSCVNEEFKTALFEDIVTIANNYKEKNTRFNTKPLGSLMRKIAKSGYPIKELTDFVEEIIL